MRTRVHCSLLTLPAGRCHEVHPRLNNGQNIQDPVPAVGAAQRAEFEALWSTAQDSSPDVLFTTELLPADLGYDHIDLVGAPIGDIWADSLTLLGRYRSGWWSYAVRSNSMAMP